MRTLTLTCSILHFGSVLVRHECDACKYNNVANRRAEGTLIQCTKISYATNTGTELGQKLHPKQIYVQSLQEPYTNIRSHVTEQEALLMFSHMAPYVGIIIWFLEYPVLPPGI